MILLVMTYDMAAWVIWTGHLVTGHGAIFGFLGQSAFGAWVPGTGILIPYIP
jgi:hypothetical protein